MVTYLTQFPFETVFYLTLFITGALVALFYVRRSKLPSPTWIALRAATIGYAVLFLMVFWYPSALQGSAADAALLSRVIQLTPLHTISTANPLSSWGTCAMLLPLPILIFLHIDSTALACTAALAVALSIEPIQLVINMATGFPNFVVDVDDVLLQLLGCLAGMLAVALCQRRAIQNASTLRAS